MIDSILEEVLSFSSITSSYLCFLLISLRRGLSSLAALSSSSMMDCVSFSLTQFFVFGKHARSCPSQLESISFFHVCVTMLFGTDNQPSTTFSIRLATKCRPFRIHSFHRFWQPSPRLPKMLHLSSIPIINDGATRIFSLVWVFGSLYGYFLGGSTITTGTMSSNQTISHNG